MRTLTEIEGVIDALPPSDKQQLLLFIAARLREHAGQWPAPRRFTLDQINAWLNEDEADLRRIRESSLQ